MNFEEQSSSPDLSDIIELIVWFAQSYDSTTANFDLVRSRSRTRDNLTQLSILLPATVYVWGSDCLFNTIC